MTPEERIWRIGPSRPVLGERVVHVWRSRLGIVSDELLERALSRAEHERGDRIRDPRRGLIWKRSRAVLREILGRYAGQHPGSVCLTTAPGGKPSLAPTRSPRGQADAENAEDPSGLHFSLSHSHVVALYAIAAGAQVGVDVEHLRAIRSPLAVAARALPAGTVGRLARVAPASRDREFLAAWTRHEASLKCRGSSVFAGSPDAGGPSRGSPPRTTPLWVGEHDVAALAVSQRPLAVHCFEWQPLPGQLGSEDADDDRLGERFAFDDHAQRDVGAMSLA
jgi:4'-phosphopantetheinyl transferase